MTSRTANASQFKRHRPPRKVFDDDDSKMPPFDPTALPEAQTAAQLQFLSVFLHCIAYALLIWSTIWIVHPKSYQQWHWEGVAILGGLCTSGPLIAATSSFWVLRRGKPLESPIGRVLIKASTSLLVPIFLPLTTLANGFESNNLLPLFVSVPLLGAMAIVGLMRLKFQGLPTAWKDERPLHWLIVASVTIPLIGLPLWSVLNIPLVSVRAAVLAGSNPYCLQVPVDYLGREQAVTHFGQLSGLRMQTPRTNGGGSTDYQFSFHSVLVVRNGTENQFYNWSYHEIDFVPVSKRAQRGITLTADCKPIPGFLYTLDLFRGAGSSG